MKRRVQQSIMTRLVELALQQLNRFVLMYNKYRDEEGAIGMPPTKYLAYRSASFIWRVA